MEKKAEEKAEEKARATQEKARAGAAGGGRGRLGGRQLPSYVGSTRALGARRCRCSAVAGPRGRRCLSLGLSAGQLRSLALSMGAMSTCMRHEV